MNNSFSSPKTRKATKRRLAGGRLEKEKKITIIKSLILVNKYNIIYQRFTYIL